MVGLVHFSQDAASNDVAAPPINWIEGQPAKSINDSAKEMMAALARWHADTTGANPATGAAGGVLSISTAQGLDPAFPWELSFTVDAENPGPMRMVVDGKAERAVQRPGNIALGPSDLVPGVVYRIRNAPGLGRYTLVSPVPEPPGKVEIFAAAGAVPKGWVVCDGRLLSRTDYAALFGAIGTTHGASGDNNFRIPDIRGRTVFGADAQGGTAAGRLTGDGNGGSIAGAVGSAGGLEAVTLVSDQMPAHTHTGSTSPAGGQAATTSGSAGAVPQRTSGSAGAHDHSVTVNSGGSHTHSGTATADTGHAHTYITAASKNGVAGSGNTNGPYWSGETEASTGTTNPSFNLTINAAGSHSHGASADTAPAHTHTIPAVDPHAHSIPAVDPHTHAMSLNSAGGGGAHPNLPPGVVLVWAIKA